MALPPHELVEIRVYHGFMDAFHLLKFPLHPIPVYRILYSECEPQLKGVQSVESGSLRRAVDWWKLLHAIICRPLIAVHSAPWSHVLLDDRKQSCS